MQGGKQTHACCSALAVPQPNGPTGCERTPTPFAKVLFRVYLCSTAHTCTQLNKLAGAAPTPLPLYLKNNSQCMQVQYIYP